MDDVRMAKSSRATQAFAATAMALVLAVLAGTQAQAAPQGTAVKAGIISTVAGSVGRPGTATNLSLVSCGVSYAAGQLYVANIGTIQEVNAQTDDLTTTAGTGGGVRWGMAGQPPRLRWQAAAPRWILLATCSSRTRVTTGSEWLRRPPAPSTGRR